MSLPSAATIASRAPILLEAIMKKEVWKPVVGWEKHYEVSSLGRVRRNAPGCGTWVGRILKPCLINSGYLFVMLHRHKDGINTRGQMLVHKLVVEAFIGPRPPKCNTHHIDSCKINNAASNLTYMSIASHSQYGSVAKLDEAKIRKIFELSDSGLTTRAVGKAIGVDCSVIWRVLNGKAWKHITVGILKEREVVCD